MSEEEINQRIDRLENLLIDLTLDKQDGETLSIGELKKELKDAGILQGVE